MEFQFLGTSSGTPTKTRNVSGLALRSEGASHWSLIDCGEGTQHRILHTSLSLWNLRAIFITHMHGDHCYGLPGLLASAGMFNRTEQMYIVGPRPLEQFVRCIMETSELGLPYPIEFVAVEHLGKTDVLPDLEVHITALSHRVPSYAYSFTERTVEHKVDVAKLNDEGIPPGPIWGQIQQGDDVMLPDGRILNARNYLLPPRKRRKTIVGGDNDTPELLAVEARTADVLIHEATYTDDILHKMGPWPQHSSAKMVAQFANNAGIRNLVLTHFSPRYQEQAESPSIADIEAEARAAYTGKLFLANDFERYVLDRAGNLAKAS
ncbi:ribonuclease Z [Massilia horti]|uniref:Ribonuclease Z n=1 Tax=Massilia horti TaxID=2562153 RepID=A0A4Y9T4B7_9BURK|nr:ribonuclease Z [Massilia horti]TFW34389.1 ribonuclease Z [Massilia horti]